MIKIRNDWPTKPVVVPGNQVNIYFDTYPNDSHNSLLWGIKAKIIGVYIPEQTCHWSLELTRVIGHFISLCYVNSSMDLKIEQKEAEENINKWLDSPLLSGGLELDVPKSMLGVTGYGKLIDILEGKSFNQNELSINEFLSELVDGKGEAEVLFQYLMKEFPAAIPIPNELSRKQGNPRKTSYSNFFRKLLKTE